MNLQLYKPNAKNTGSGFNFSVSTREEKPSFYVNAIQQFSWDNSKKTGSFSGNKENDDKKIAIKLNNAELGEMLSSFSSRVPWAGFHDFNGNKTTIALTPWDKSRTVTGKDKQRVEHTVPAFGFTISRNGNQTFRMSLEPGEVEILKQFIIKYLDMSFEASAFTPKQRPSTQTQSPAPAPTPSPMEDEDIPF